MNDSTLVPAEIAVEIIIQLFDTMKAYPIKTAEGFRNAALGNGMFAINPLLDINKRPDVDFLMDVIRKTIREGRMIDFGFISNKVLKAECVRAREVFEAGELRPPYPTWLAVSSWEGGMCGYYFSPYNTDADDREPNRILGVELYGVSHPSLPDAVLVNDIVSLEVVGPGETRIHPYPMINGVLDTDDGIQTRGANLLDPLVTFLRFLADASIPIVDRPAPEKLNRHRVRQGKFPIPAHTRVETRDYVSMMTRHASHQAPQGGHHASPIAHWRRAHQRQLGGGRVVPVRSSKVNWRDTEELHRLFYRINNETEKRQ